MPKTKTADKHEVSNDKLVLHSALRLGDSSAASTGYMFRLQAIGPNKNLLIPCVEEFTKEMKETIQQNKGAMLSELFITQKVSDDTVAVFINPPKGQSAIKG